MCDNEKRYHLPDGMYTAKCQRQEPHTRCRAYIWWDSNPVGVKVFQCLSCNGKGYRAIRYPDFLINWPCDTCNGAGKFHVKVSVYV